MIEDPAIQQSIVNITHAVLGASGGGGIILYIGKFLFQQFVTTFKEYAIKIDVAVSELTSINVKLKLLEQHNISIEKLQEAVQSHETRIHVLEARLLDEQRRNTSNPPSSVQ